MAAFMRDLTLTIRGGVIPALMSVLLLAGCSMFQSEQSNLTAEVQPAGQIYGEADQLLGAGKYEDAAKRFEDVDREHPYSPQARRALAMAAFAYHKAEMHEQAISAGQRYITLHPGTKEAALAHHIVASSYFEQIGGPARDQTNTKKAIEELRKLVRRYPDSEYAEKARNRIRIAEDTLAAHEMNVGRYYMKQANYVGAINRFKTVVREHQTTPHVEEALHRLTECYLSIGIVNEAQTAAAVLGHNFPDSPWYKDSYALLSEGGYAPAEDSSSWISKAWSSTVASINPF